MASRRKMPRSKARDKNPDILAQFGIVDMPDLDLDQDVDDDNDDNDLETELQALLSGQDVKPVKKNKKAMNIMDVEKMASDCMRDISIDEEDLSGDDELLNELQTLTEDAEDNSSPPNEAATTRSDAPYKNENLLSDNSMVSLLTSRLELYVEAEAAAKQCADSSKVRRYGRAIKTLKNQLKLAESGGVIVDEDIPPVVTIPKPKSASATELEETAEPLPPPLVPTRTTSMIAPTNENTVPLDVPTSSSKLLMRRNEYKIAALRAKKAGDTETALLYVKIAKKFDAVIEAESNGHPIDLSNCPPPPPKYSDPVKGDTPIFLPPPKAESSENQASASTVDTEALQKAALEAADEPPDSSFFGAPPPPTTVLEALEQRLQKYCSTRDTAKAEGNSSKARRLQRIVQQYESAIKTHKAGRPVDFEELPIPPGFGPIPLENTKPLPEKSKRPSPVLPAATMPKTDHSPSLSESPKQSSGGRNPKVQRANTSSILDKQLHFLLERQKLFRSAALESKKNGDVQQAKEYLRMSKGFDSMIEATKSGLPIDATTIPTPPQLENDYVIIDKSECYNSDSVENGENLFATLEKELQHQIKMCDRNKEHFMTLGDVSSASKFEKWSLDSKKDLVAIQHLWRNGESCPMFHYETRLISLVQCNTELSDNDLEVAVERGINLPGKPEELDSYIRLELPIPTESPQRAKTHTVRDTNNPIFQATFKFEINRKSRSQMRLFKRQMLKCEVWSKGGFFRGDTLLGTVNAKLSDLETKCSFHDSLDLMDGRKACGGKLEIKMKIRDPLLVKQVEEVREKWLVIDGYSSRKEL